MAVATGSKIGVDLTQSQTAATFGLGDRTTGTQDTLWVYVQMNGACSAGDCVVINSTGTATRATPALSVGTKNNELAFAQFAFADTEYGWVARNGYNLTIGVSATVSSSATLYLATSSGKLSDVAGSATITGVQVVTVSTTATLTTTTGALSWPKNNGLAS